MPQREFREATGRHFWVVVIEECPIRSFTT
jgi:hypothetical protein